MTMAPLLVSISTLAWLPSGRVEVARAQAQAALGEAELRGEIGERGDGEVGAVAQAQREAGGLQLGERLVVGVDAVARGERVVGLGGGELVDAGGLERDVAFEQGDACDAVGRVLRRTLRSILGQSRGRAANKCSEKK